MKVILIDDEKPMLLIMEKMLLKIPEVEIAGTFQSTAEAYKYINKNSVDIIFADIKMPEENGLSFARRIMSEFKGIELVFLTSYKKYALDAFEVDAIDYIIKPVSQERLKHVVQKILHRRILMLPSRNDMTTAKLYVYCLGGLDIKGSDGGRVQLKSSKSQELLAYLLLHKGKPVSKWNVMEAVFHKMNPRNAEIYLNTTIYRLRKSLEDYDMKAAIICENESYRIDLKDIYIDFIEFERSSNLLHIINELNVEKALNVEETYSGNLFGDKGYSWSLSERVKIFEIYSDFAKRLGGYLLEKGNLDAALCIFKKIANRNELDEEINCLLMSVYAAKRDMISLIKQYNKYEKLLKRDLQVTPSNIVTELYRTLRKSFE